MRLVITHIHVRVPQGFAYAIQYALQGLTQIGAPGQFRTTPSQERGIPWNIIDIAQTPRKAGEDEGDRDGTIYTFRVDNVLAGIRPISPNDQMFQILDRGNVDMHSSTRIGLPDPNFSGKKKIAFKAHVFNGHGGTGGHLVYFRQQMTKVGPTITEAMEDMGERMFGGHALDMEERAAWRAKWGAPPPAADDYIDRIIARIWLTKGATRATLDEARSEQQTLSRELAFAERRNNAPHKRKQPQNSDRGWRGSQASSTSGPWTVGWSEASGSDTHFADWSYTRGDPGTVSGTPENRGKLQQPASWGTYAAAQTAASSSDSHSGPPPLAPLGALGGADSRQHANAWGTPEWDGITWPRASFQPWQPGGNSHHQ